MVADLNSVSQAAVTLNMSQPAVSRTIASVERYFGATLLHRTGRGVVPTQAGLEALKAIEQSTLSLEEARSNILSATGHISGKVTIGVTPMVGQTMIARVVRRVRTEHPNIDVRTLEGNGSAITKWLAEGQIDLAVTYIPPAQIGSHQLAEVLIEEPLCVVGRDPFNQAFLPLKEICDLPLAMPSKASGMRRHVDRLASARGLNLNIKHQVDSYSTIIGLVIDGAAYTVVPFLAVRTLNKSGAVSYALITEPDIAARLSVHRSPKQVLRQAGRIVIKICKEECTALQQDLSKIKAQS